MDEVYKISGETLNEIVAAIHEKNSEITSYTAAEFADKIRQIPQSKGSGTSMPAYLDLELKKGELDNGLESDKWLKISINNYEKIPDGSKIYMFYQVINNGTSRWIHPVNYDKLATTGKYHLGYYCIASGPYSDGEYDYPDIPKWMPNSGKLQTEFDITDEILDNGCLFIDLTEYLIPLVKPVNPDQFDNFTNGKFQDCELALFGRPNCLSKPLNITFRLVNSDGDLIDIPNNSILIGVSRFTDQPDSFIFPLASVTSKAKINGKKLYSKII